MHHIAASKIGIQRLHAAREKRRWHRTEGYWLDTAKVSRSTMNRLWGGQAIRQDNFESICKAIGVPWQEIADPNTLPATETFQPETLNGIHIPNKRCRQLYGRDRLIERTLDLLANPETPPILALSGGPGYGKTEAAGQIARAALQSDRFADALWVTARQTELVDGQIGTHAAQNTLDWKPFLYQLAHQLQCPTEAVCTRLRQKPYLIVLDNAETANVESILPQLNRMLDPSRALLTSRRKTVAPYLQDLPVTGLDFPASQQLLQDEAQHHQILVLLQAATDTYQHIHALSCGAPLALHFIVGRVCHDRALEPVLAELERAEGRVETFYTFCLQTAWQRLDDSARDILRYMGEIADAGVSQTELLQGNDLDSNHLLIGLAELRRWYLLEDRPDERKTLRHDLHPWVRSSVRSGLVEKWQPSLGDLERIAQWKFGIDPL